MAKIGVKIEATEEGTEQRATYENLPSGVYKLELESGDVSEKDEGTPQHAITVKMTAQVLEPEDYAGKKLFLNYNVQHPKEIVQKIGGEQFQCLLRAMEMSEVPDDDTDNLLFHSFVATIGMGKDSKEKNADGTPKYAARNEIKRYWFPDQGNTPEIGLTSKPANDNRPAPAKAAAPAAAATKPAGSRPWGKK